MEKFLYVGVVIWFLLISTMFVAMTFLFAPLLRTAKLAWLAAGLGMVAIAGLYIWKGHPELADKQNSLQAQYYYSEGLLSQSVSAYEDLITLYPDDTALKAEYDKVLLDLSKISKEELQIIQTVAELKQRLYTENSANAKEWRLLANSQMQLGAYDDALVSFKRAVMLEPDNTAYADELARAVNFIEAQSQAQDMSPEDQQAMIDNMVSGLSARLRDKGGTAEEWQRLIKVRQVRGEDALLAEELDIMKKQFEDQPDMIDQILARNSSPD